MSLAAVSTADLRRLRDLVAGRAIAFPLTESALRAQGFGAFAPALLRELRFDGPDAIVAALDLVLDARTYAHRPPLELVWTGPDTTAPQARDTAIVLAELFGRTQKRVLVAGYVFTHGAAILRPLHEALLRGVEARMFLDIDGAAPTVAQIPQFAEQQIRTFIQRNWPFGAPYPEFFYDPRTASPLLNAILHAKCAVVDGRWSLVTSANFTSAAQTRNIEVGVLVDDPSFASRLEGQFNALVAQGMLHHVLLT